MKGLLFFNLNNNKKIDSFIVKSLIDLRDKTYPSK